MKSNIKKIYIYVFLYFYLFLFFIVYLYQVNVKKFKLNKFKYYFSNYCVNLGALKENLKSILVKMKQFLNTLK